MGGGHLAFSVAVSISSCLPGWLGWRQLRWRVAKVTSRDARSVEGRHRVGRPGAGAPLPATQQ